MGLELRAIGEDEGAAYRRVSAIAFANSPPAADDLDTPWVGVEYDRTLCAFDGKAMVGVSRVISFDFSVPGGRLPAVAGVADVGVLPTHRRQGVLTAMMRRTLDDAHHRGEPVALLTASEGGIYGRFGFGVSVLGATVEVTKEGAEVTVPVEGSVELMEPDEALSTIVGLFDATRGPGDVNRFDWWWDQQVVHPTRGRTPPFVAVHRAPSGEPDGYALYRINSGSDGRTANVSDVVATSASAYAALWRYLIGIDLVRRISSWARPVDESVRWMLNDPRKARITSVSDHLWSRLVDVPAALGARAYGAAGELVLEVADPLCPWNDSTFRLEGGPDGAECGPAGSTASPDIVTDAAALGQAWLGGIGFAELARAGRLDERRPGAAARADAMFATARAPHARTGF